jgi:hypothetical protein
VNCLKRIWVAGSSFQEAGTLEVSPSMVTGVPAASKEADSKGRTVASVIMAGVYPLCVKRKLPATVYALGLTGC